MKKVKHFLILIFYILSISFTLSCTPIKKINQTLLNGYWKIDFVSQKNEIFKLKEDAVLLDYYFLDKNNGWRKKIRPLINNRFETSTDTTFFEIINKEKEALLIFETKWHDWNEMIIALDSISLILKIQDKKYHYKRINP